jgi:hypothetical protein
MRGLPLLKHSAIFVVLVYLGSPLSAQPPASARAASELVKELTSRNATVMAVKDPDHPGFYLAVSYLPGPQLLAVSAQSTAPEYVDYLLTERKYADVYATLNGASVAQGKLFVQDMRADGLKPAREDGAFDIVYQNVVNTTLFNGDWKQQKMSERGYRDAYQDLEARYARVLSLLLNQLRSTGE